MKNATAKIIDITPEPAGTFSPLPAADISWERAKALYDDAENFARRSGEKLIELSHVLARLKAEFFRAGQGHRSDQTKLLGRGAEKLNPSPAHHFPKTEKGWEQVVRERIGISARTANRIIERGTKLELIQGLAEGHDVIYNDTTGKDKTLSPTPEIQRLAQEMWVEVINGTVSAPRAWAGIVGEGLRTDDQAGVKQRAPVNHYRVMLRAVDSLLSCASHWDEMQPHERAEIEQRWSYVTQFLPSTLQAKVTRKK